jgi:hypothetical protein
MKTVLGKKIDSLLDGIVKDDSPNREVVAALKAAVHWLDVIADQGNTSAPEALKEIMRKLGG